jgi:dextranase
MKKALGLMVGLACVTQAHAALLWVGNVYHCPRDGNINSTDDVWVYIESFPQGSAASARVVHSSDNGTNWSSVEMSAAGALGVNDRWHVNLGQFPPGTTVQYAVEVRDGSGGSLWDTNGGGNYWFTVNSAYWIGSTSQSPVSGELDPQDDLIITTETFPINAAGSVRVLVSGDCGTNWTETAMQKIGAAGNNDVWRHNAGKFGFGACVKYKMEADFGVAGTRWDPNGGAFETLVNGAKPVAWIGKVRHEPLNGQIDPTDDIIVFIETTPIGAATFARAVYSTNDGASWSDAELSRAGTVSTNDLWSVNLGQFAAGTTVRYAVEVRGSNGSQWDTNYGVDYRVVVNAPVPSPWIGGTYHHPANGDLESTDELWINTATRPLGAATSARVVWSTDAGTNWNSTALTGNGDDGTSSLWHVNLGTFPPGTVVFYAVEGTFPTNTVWDTNSGANYRANVKALSAVGWMGYTYTYPKQGEIDPGDDLWINTETGPKGAATTVRALFTTNNVDWTWVELTPNGANDNNDLWHVNLGQFPEGARVEFVLEATGAVGDPYWDNNYWQNYYATVNTIIRDVYTDKARYNPGETARIFVELAGGGEVQVKIRRLFQEVASFTTNAAGPGTYTFDWQTWHDDFRGYGVDVDFVVAGAVRDSRSSAIDVSSTWARFPRYGWFTDFYPGETAEDSAAKTAALSKYHINVVQFYDWKWTHDRLLPYDCAGSLLDSFFDWGFRNNSISVITNKVNATKSRGMSPVFYDLIYGDSGNNLGPEHITWAAFDGPWQTDAKDVYDQFSTIWIMDVSNPDWQAWIFNQFKDAMLKLGFEGVHLDNLGGAWKYKYNSDQGIQEWIEFPNFIANCKTALQSLDPAATVTHNDVYGGYLDNVAPAATDIYYSEVWGWDRYNDIRTLIQRARTAGGGKSVVLAAYMNFKTLTDALGNFRQTNELNEASIRLMDACVFGNGAYHVELGEDGQMLSHYYWPARIPMPATLPRVMRDYYDFAVRYENLLVFNTLGGITDGTESARLSSSTHTLSTNALPDTIWTVVKLWRDEYDTVSLINLHGVDDQWRNLSGSPQFQQNISMKYYLDKKCQRLYLATPDDGLGRPVELAFTEGTDALGYFVQFTVPSLKFWDLLVFDKTTRVKVDGWPGDWTGTPPSRVHEWSVSNGEWIYRGEANDYRTFAGASANQDITEVRITSDDTYAYFLVRMAGITDASLPAIGIAWNSHLSTGASWIGDASSPTGSIALENAEQYATRQIMFYSAAGTPKIRLWNGSGWYVPPAADAAIAVSTSDNVIEARINKLDLDLFSPQRVTVTLASFRSSGADAGNDCTFDAVPDNNNDAMDLMGGDVGVSENAWARDLSDNAIRRHYDLTLGDFGAEPERLYVAFPGADGQKIDIWTHLFYTIAIRFSDTLAADVNNFTIKIDGVEMPRAQYFFRDEAADDFMNEIRYVWGDPATGLRLIEVTYDDGFKTLSATRLVHVNPDSDGDGLTDGFEDGTARDGRIEGDTNNNRAYDAGEKWVETDPDKADTDDDDLPDGWEVQHGFIPWDDGIPGHTNLNTAGIIATTEHGAAGDPDGDGLNNYGEFVAGTNPRNAGSALRILDIVRQADGSRLITWSSVAGKSYRVAATADLTSPYAPLSGIITATGTTTNYTDSSAPATRCYYRVQVLNP